MLYKDVVSCRQKIAKKLHFFIDMAESGWYNTHVNSKSNNMPPSQRAAGKTNLMIWLPDEIFAEFKSYAERTGLSMTAIITAYIIECINKEK